VETRPPSLDAHGGRRGRSTEHARHHIIDRIYEAWYRGGGQVASLLLLDVSGAFDNVSHQRLLHNLRKKTKTVRWIVNLLADPYTRIFVDGFKTERHKMLTGTVQGSTLSPILYIFYNADPVQKCNLADDTTATGFIDDVAISGGETRRWKRVISFIRHSRPPSSGRKLAPLSFHPSSPTSAGHA
jgi:retron-type reverse transcriptase